MVCQARLSEKLFHVLQSQGVLQYWRYPYDQHDLYAPASAQSPLSCLTFAELRWFYIFYHYSSTTSIGLRYLVFLIERMLSFVAQDTEMVCPYAGPS